MSKPILQKSLPFAPWMDPRTARLPGTVPIDGDDWLRQDDAFAPQMAERDRLIERSPEVVHRTLESARPAVAELFARVLEEVQNRDGYRVGAEAVVRPDGVEVPLSGAEPMLVLGRLVQEDLCVMEKSGDEHVLTAACLCFPASWSLEEKIGRPLIGIHRTVKPYDADLARRVQRMFEAIRPESPLWRMNALVYRDPSLFQARREGDPRVDRTGGSYLRAERQCLMRLPKTRAVVFSIHTYVVHLDDLEPGAREGLAEARL